MKSTAIAALLAGVAFAGTPLMAEEISIALHVDPGHEMFQVGERLKEKIEDETDGRYTVTLLGTEVGGERDHLEGASIGEYTIALGGSMPMTLYAPEYAAADLPFVYSSSDQARQVYEGDIGGFINEALVANGNLRLVGLSMRSPRNLTSREPVQGPDDVQGVRLRLPEIEPWVEIWSEIGALPSPIAWPEVYTSLQTGVIDMQENPVSLIYNGRLYEVQNYLNRTQHVHSFFHWLINEEFYAGLSDEDRTLIQGAIDEAVGWGDELVRENEEKILATLKEEGMEVVEPDVAAFREKAIPAIRRVAEGFAPEVRDYVLSHID
ncbi:TRAP-type C4-dicarboxylate transport system substrate-binding protein [Limimaricola soesokkakensis]|uniref:2,3-diketo-L-gulonate-binding periplasmic protein YiaO n=1 Tax=Limimaricola soesokkakensis TaxID=1343159 RepID=A0A1X6YU25_9RHOB|nr:TRAP transporter substrate-binding protein [Limimaricola soesokkakensis]PSK87543.1 TRAP-type C4-dicarboxylate transport system substrate-binding protein [Limimaricola soesokkakensis]SLN30916.1 2,3-diketo-L-gulonate-binding periplasmic protein YiaO precursor [Limimaricola soesokkakensis]